MGDGTFAGVSATAGVDFVDDGRALVVTDWDGDGDLDLWMRNRSGPQLRFMRNDGANNQHFVQFRLQGTLCNRDAIGATVEVRSGQRRIIRTLIAGDGFLAQSSKQLHFGLGESNTIDHVLVRWPNGKSQEFTGPASNRTYLIVEGNPSLSVLPKRSVKIKCGELPTRETPSSVRLLLKVPLPLPPSITRLKGSTSNSVLLINLWAKWCAGCRTELSAFSAASQRLTDNAITVVALNLDEERDQNAATQFFNDTVENQSQAISLQLADGNTRQTIQTVLEFISGRPSSAPLPTSLLVDPAGQLQIVYLGPVSVDQLIADAQSYGHRQVPFHERMAYPGRWYSKPRRNLRKLAKELKHHGCIAESRFFEQLVGRKP